MINIESEIRDLFMRGLTSDEVVYLIRQHYNSDEEMIASEFNKMGIGTDEREEYND